MHIKTKKTFNKNQKYDFKKIRNMIVLLFTIIGFLESCEWVKDKIYPPEKNALLYYNSGVNLYREREYESAKPEFEKTYKIDPNFLDVKYYYALTLLRIDQDKYATDANLVFLKSHDRLNDNEKVLYMVTTLMTSNNYKKGYNIYKSIQDPFYLYSERFCDYIKYSTLIGLSLDFNRGESQLFENDILIQRKLSSLLNYPTEIKKFSDTEIEVKPIEMFSEESNLVKQATIEMYLIYLNKCMEHNKLEKILPVMNISSEYFDVFNTDESVARDYLRHYYDCFAIFGGFNDEHLALLNNIHINITDKLVNGNPEIWNNDLQKCYQIKEEYFPNL